MRKKNNIFAAAFDELKRNHGIKTQKELARRMGVSEDTITRILKDRTEVTEDIITKLQTASGCIFNLQWLRGESDIMLIADNPKLDSGSPQVTPAAQLSPDMSSVINAAIAAYSQTIEALKRESAAKDETIASMQATINEQADHINTLKGRLMEYRKIIDAAKIEIGNYPFPMGVAEDNNYTTTK